jgi:outer membrane protein assembly factor BamD (BamD/ComL family)
LRFGTSGLVTLALLVAGVRGGETAKADSEAEALLKSAQEAYTKKDWTAATTRFRDTASRFPKTPSAAAAKFGLAVCLIDGHDKQYAEAKKLLDSLKGDEKGVDGTQLTYYQGSACRGLAVLEIAQAQAKDAGKHNDAAKDYFKQAADFFAKARDGFAARGADAFIWTALATTDLAEMKIRLGDYKAAVNETKVCFEGLAWKVSKYRTLAIYYHGFANFMLNERGPAERSLSMLAPFKDVRFGTHAHYLLARLYHLADDRTEAARHYDAVIDDYTREKKEAQAALTKITELARDPVEKLRVETLARETSTPDHVIRAFFYSAVLLMESGRFGDARERLKAFAKAPANYPLALEAKVRLGICEVQLKEGPAALATLEPLIDKDQALNDQIVLWTGRAAVLAVPDRAPQAAHDKAVAKAIELYTKAASAAQARYETDANAKGRHGEILLELVDVLLQFNRGADAVKACQELKTKGLLKDRGEDLAQREVEAFHLAGDYDKCDDACKQFLQKYPDSAFKPAVLFRFAENGYFRSLAAEQEPAKQEAAGLKKLREETLKRYQRLIDDYPDHPRASSARFAAGLLYMKLGDTKNAANVFEQIPPTDRTGEKAISALLLADLILKEVPAGVPEDALTAGRMEADLKKAVEMLASYTASQPAAPQMAEALIRLGQIRQRLATLQVQPAERQKYYQEARAAFDAVLQPQFNNNPLQALALLERARCRALYGGDQNKSITELRAFLNDPLRSKPAAPLAVVQITSWLRDQKKNPEALGIIAKFAEDYAKMPNPDAGMRGLLAYHHGLALQAAGKPGEARAQYALALELIPDRTEGADAAVRQALCKKDEALQLRDNMQKLLSNPSSASQEKGRKLRDEMTKLLREAVNFLDAQADKLRDKPAAAEARARMLYEAAWIFRTMADEEIAAVKADKLAALQKQQGDRLKKLPPPQILLSEVPPQPSEAKARARYAALIESFGDTPLSLQARIELAEYFADRDEPAEAVKMLVDALDREPPPDVAERVRLLLGICQAARGNHKQAVTQFDIVGQNVKSPLSGEAKLRAGEVHMVLKEYAEAAKRLAVFRDNGQYQKLPDISDRALLRLGHALAAQKQWDASRQALELLVQRFGNSKWLQDAHFGIGFAREELNQHDQAIQSYIQATTGALSETAAMAQLRIGVCRMTLKRYQPAAEAFLSVADRFGYDAWGSAALLEAAEAYAQLKMQNEQVQVLNRLIREYADTPAAKEGKTRLAKLQK